MEMILEFARKFIYWKFRSYHFTAFLTKNSLKKTLNLLRNYRESKGRVPVMRAKPYILSLELSNRCNLRCKFCPTGKRKDTRESGWLSIEILKKILNDTKDTAYMASLHGWGEPLLHPKFDEAIRLIHEANIYTVLSTNGSFLNDENIEKILNSGLDHLVIAIDGASPETYSQYRVGGDFSAVIEGSKKLFQRRKMLGLKKPYVEWQYVVFRHNEHELKNAEQLSKEIGFDHIEFMPAYAETPEYESTIPEFQSRKSPLSKPSDCKFLWSSLTVYWDGRIASCCWDYYATSGFGNILEKKFDQIWNNSTYQKARSLAGERVLPEQSSKLICNDCIKNINIESPSVIEYNKRNSELGTK